MIEKMTAPVGTQSDTSFRFKTPAHQVDFPEDPAKQLQMDTAWNTHLNGFVQQGILGNPWTSTNVPVATNFYNPEVTPDAGAAVIFVEWGAFPGRIQYYNPGMTPDVVLSLGDTGYYPNGVTSFPPITVNPCSGQTVAPMPYGPYGPRGWQDEYCEWAVTRNSQGKITRIDFTCENPEYWNTLWAIDPQKVLELYQTTLDNPNIRMVDLILTSGGLPINDPSTGRPAYNPLNKYNFGTQVTADGGGAMHLTSTPNTLQTEIGLGATATPQRTCGSSDFNTLICQAGYGQPHRNSDPNIGGTINHKVGQNFTVTLTNPPGLYIQTPDFSSYQTPDGTDAGKFWTIKRGKETLVGDDGKLLPGNFILHAVFEVPASYGYTVSDIKIGLPGKGAPIAYAGQVADTINMHILASAMPQNAGPAYGKVEDAPIQLPQPLQMFHARIYEVMKSNNVPNPVQYPMTLISNSTMIPPSVKQGATAIQMVLVMTGGYVDISKSATWPTLVFDGPDLSCTITKAEKVTYAIPGNSYPSDSIALWVNLTVASNATKGLRSIGLKNKDVSNPIPLPALLQVI